MHPHSFSLTQDLTPPRHRPARTPKAAAATLVLVAATLLGLPSAGNAAAPAAQATPTLSLAEQMRAMLGKPAAGNAPGTPAGAGKGAGPLAGGSAGTGAGQGTAPLFTAAPAQAAAPLLVEGPAQLRQSATELAQRFPAAQRGAMSKAFEESFAFWQKLETQLGLASNDLAAGVAAFIAGNYAAFTQQQVADEHFKTLVRQMQGLLGQNAGIQQASPAQRRAMYEQLAMVGTFMVVYREQLRLKPNPAEEVHFRNTARANLETALGVGVERLQIGAQGLEIR